MFNLSSILIEPIDLNIFVSVKYSKLSKKILLVSVSVITVLKFDDINFFDLFINKSSVFTMYLLDVIIFVIPIVLNIFVLSLYSA